MKWIDDETVEIDEIKLNIDKDYYKAVGGEVFTSIKRFFVK